MGTQDYNELMRDDFSGFIKDLRDEVEVQNVGFRKSIYAVMEKAAYAITYLMDNPKAFDALLRDVFFVHMHRKPNRAGPAVFMFIEKAKDKNSREQCSRRGRAVEELLRRDCAPDEVARQLFENGGIMSILALKDVQAGNDVEDCSQKPNLDDAGVAGRHALAKRRRNDGDDDELTEPNKNVDDDSWEDGEQHEGVRRRRATIEPSWMPAGLPAPSAGCAYLFLEMPIADLYRYIEVGSYSVQYEVFAAKGKNGAGFRRAVVDLTEEEEEEG